MIDDAQGAGDGGGTMPFHLWPAQTQVLWSFLCERLVLILKARQLGISWLCCGYALWLCLFQPGKVVLCFSKGQGDANELLRRVKVLYERLPAWIRDACPNVTTDNSTRLGFDNESRVESHPATQGAGRGLTASLVILDEAAHLVWATALYTALKPVIDGGGQFIILSTANGIGNLFHRLWTKAAGKLNKFCTIFLPWWSRPGRDAAWYRAMVDESAEPALVPQEYPGSANEAFVSTGRVRFAAKWVQGQLGNIRAALDVALVPSLPRGLRDAQERGEGVYIYTPPQPGRKYLTGADVAEGLENRDCSAAVVIDAESWEEVACLHGHWEPDEYGLLLLALATWYDADLAIERNNHGHTVIAAIKAAGGLKRVLKALDDDRPGWVTNQKTKPLSINLLAESLRDVLPKVRTAAAIDEMQIYQVLKNGGTGAPSGYHDDLVMAWAIALINARRPKKRQFGAS